jgi:rhodanese-related sulfurtransferase
MDSLINNQLLDDGINRDTGDSLKGETMAEPERITPEEAYQKLKNGKALLVCAYEDDAKFKMMQLQGAISLSEFKAKLPSLPKDGEIIFYCG